MTTLRDVLTENTEALWDDGTEWRAAADILATGEQIDLDREVRQSDGAVYPLHPSTGIVRSDFVFREVGLVRRRIK